MAKEEEAILWDEHEELTEEQTQITRGKHQKNRKPASKKSQIRDFRHHLRKNDCRSQSGEITDSPRH